MGDFWDAWWQQTYQVKSIVLGYVRTLRTTSAMEVYLVSLLPPSVPKFPIAFVASVKYIIITFKNKELEVSNILMLPRKGFLFDRFGFQTLLF